MADQNITFYVYDDLSRFLESFDVNLNAVNEAKETNYCNLSRFNSRKKFVAVLEVDGYFLSVFVRLIKMSEPYSRMVFNNIVKTFLIAPAGCDIRVKFKLVKPKLEILDYAWNGRISNLIAEKQELAHAMSWLSTLGGAFSALGDRFENCAKVAGKISLQQCKIAFQLGEPLLVARCRLYMALSLIQLGNLSMAKTMIQKQHQVAKDFKDIRLEKMCKGVWAKLQYVCKQKKISRKNFDN